LKKEELGGFHKSGDIGVSMVEHLLEKPIRKDHGAHVKKI
jgi:hypothetical protein